MHTLAKLNLKRDEQKLKDFIDNNPDSAQAAAYRLGRKLATVELLDYMLPRRSFKG